MPVPPSGSILPPKEAKRIEEALEHDRARFRAQKESQKCYGSYNK